jgi:hypothetical protein|tara:strand:+ start:347 stop:448 length:102 start_codon:yes stop_codon:yes gene_type:complete
MINGGEIVAEEEDGEPSRPDLSEEYTPATQRNK